VESAAPPATDASASAVREVFDRGVKHFTAGRLEEALREFREASALRPQPALTVTIATCLERLGRRGEAFAEYREYLRSSGAQIGAARRDAVEVALARLRLQVAFLEITPPGPGISVAVDGRHVDLGTEPFPVDPGAHLVEPELLEGHLVRERVVVSGGETRAVTLRFPPRPRPTTAGEAEPPALLAVVSGIGVRDEQEHIVDLMLTTPLRDWVPKRGRWIGPAAALLALGVGALAGATWALQRALPQPAPAARTIAARSEGTRAEPRPAAPAPGSEPSRPARSAAEPPAPRPGPEPQPVAPRPRPGSEPQPVAPRPRPADSDRTATERAPPAAPDRLVEVEVTLLLNGIQACDRSPPGHRREVVTRTRTITGDGRDGGSPGVLVEIADTGPGISLEAAPRLFEPFFTTRDTGTGLGLPIARRIVESHGGTLTVTNDSRGGVSARIVLSVATEEAA
jgi:hypothetical protein